MSPYGKEANTNERVGHVARYLCFILEKPMHLLIQRKFRGGL